MKGVLASLLLVSATVGMAEGIKWNTDLNRALSIAKKTHRPVMIDFYGET